MKWQQANFTGHRAPGFMYSWHQSLDLMTALKLVPHSLFSITVPTCIYVKIWPVLLTQPYHWGTVGSEGAASLSPSNQGETLDGQTPPSLPKPMLPQIPANQNMYKMIMVVSVYELFQVTSGNAYICNGSLILFYHTLRRAGHVEIFQLLVQ